MFTPLDQSFMRRALELAGRGLYTTTPNPRVGALVVKEGRTLGEGFHQVAGESHAEVNAIADATVAYLIDQIIAGRKVDA